MEIITLIENEMGNCSKLKNEFGLSLYIKDEDIELIFDTGKSGEFTNNAEKLGIDLKNIRHIVLSHSHFDHTGGMRTLIEKYNKDFTLHISKTFFQEKYRITEEKIEFLGNNFDEKYLLDNKIKIDYIEKNEIRLSKNITLFTNFQQINNFETPVKYYFRKIDNNYILDKMEDEIVIGVETSKGLVVICGCSHIGIVNIIENIKRRTNKKIYGIIGGLHLTKASAERIKTVMRYFEENEIKFLGVSHCTGEEAVNIFKTSDIYFIQNNTGNKIVF